MKTILGVAICALSLAIMAIPTAAQGQQGQQPPPSVAMFVRNAYNGNKNNILRSAAKMPEEFYGLRPGTQQEVRTFGQHLSHVATFNYLWCSQAKNEKNPNAGNNLEKSLTAKADIVKAVTDSFAYCDGAFNALTDANGGDIIDMTLENGRQVHQARMALLILDLMHNNELYGNIVTTMRMKDIVPPSSEPRPAQGQPKQ